MSAIEDDIRGRMMSLLKSEEDKTDLTGLSVISRVGMKVATAFSAEVDADAVSASCTALIDLGLRLSDATNHGSLTELVLHNKEGYSVVIAINEEYIVFGGLKVGVRIGYYLGYLRELAKKLSILISGGEITQMALSLEEDRVEQIKQQQIEEEEAGEVQTKPSVEQDKAAMDELLTFLDDWDEEEKTAMGVIEDFEDLEDSGNVVGIPQGTTVGIPQGGSVGIPQGGSVDIPQEATVDIPKEEKPQFKVYDDEIPPVPLDDYTPMEIEEESITQQAQPEPVEELPPLDELPSFDELATPDFSEIPSSSEYETEFVLKKESGALDSVLEDLGWDDEE